MAKLKEAIRNVTQPSTHCLVFTHCGLVNPCGDTDLSLHRLRWWLVAWRYQAFTWTNVYFSSVKFCGINLKAISQPVPKPLATILYNVFENKLLKWLPHLTGTKELILVIPPFLDLYRHPPYSISYLGILWWQWWQITGTKHNDFFLQGITFNVQICD